MESLQQFQLVDNQLQFRQVFQQNNDGVKLSPEEQQYLLPHFLMLLIGKPGSGKTTLLKQLLVNPQMYARKFDEVIVVSPSYAKMDLKIKQENVRSKFQLDWIFQKINVINQKQQEKIYGCQFGAGITLPQDKLSATGTGVKTKSTVLNDEKSRFQMATFLKKYMDTGLEQQQQHTPGSKKQEKDDQEEEEFAKYQQQIYKEIQQMSPDRQKETHVNVLLVLDDVVSSIKKAEFDPRLSQLVMNRRHLLFNGTLSIIIVSQKYTMIPVRIRSNANWLVLYQLNPVDLENIYRDIIIHPIEVWRNILDFVFGSTLIDKKQRAIQIDQQQRQEQDQTIQQQLENVQAPSAGDFDAKKTFEDFMKSKKYENLGIWVEFNIYFKNFKRIMI